MLNKCSTDLKSKLFHFTSSVTSFRVEFSSSFIDTNLYNLMHVVRMRKQHRSAQNSIIFNHKLKTDQRIRIAGPSDLLINKHQLDQWTVQTQDSRWNFLTYPTMGLRWFEQVYIKTNNYVLWCSSDSSVDHWPENVHSRWNSKHLEVPWGSWKNPFPKVLKETRIVGDFHWLWMCEAAWHKIEAASCMSCSLHVPTSTRIYPRHTER